MPFCKGEAEPEKGRTGWKTGSRTDAGGRIAAWWDGRISSRFKGLMDGEKPVWECIYNKNQNSIIQTKIKGRTKLLCMFLLKTHDFGVGPVSWMRKDRCFELSKLAALRPPPFFSSNDCVSWRMCLGHRLTGQHRDLCRTLCEDVQLCWGWTHPSMVITEPALCITVPPYLPVTRCPHWPGSKLMIGSAWCVQLRGQ